MSMEFVINMAERAVMTILLVAGPLLIVALVIGLIVSIFQATTQIQEQTLAFIPKIVGVLVALVILGPWMLSEILSFTQDILTNLTKFVG
ncbi:flagellar biosynthesis protein FliQ [Camelliibacillus cellulosilyticus]|uniref:Flagellar biosynthetic protein FliQ n=1 Tax=Camelliibacillus cellulosilyticus TaxID=2174486 RepID=A0ABV9GH88_9BACL